MSSTRWVALRLELMTNLVTLVVALFLVFGLSSVPHSYKAMAFSLVLQVRDGLSDSRGPGRRLVVVCGLCSDNSFPSLSLSFPIYIIGRLDSAVSGLLFNPNILILLNTFQCRLPSSEVTRKQNKAADSESQASSS